MPTIRTVYLKNLRARGGLIEVDAPDLMMARRLVRLIGQIPLAPPRQLLIRLPKATEQVVHMGPLEAAADVMIYEAETYMEDGQDVLNLTPLERLCSGEEAP